MPTISASVIKEAPKYFRIRTLYIFSLEAIFFVKYDSPGYSTDWSFLSRSPDGKVANIENSKDWTADTPAFTTTISK